MILLRRPSLRAARHLPRLAALSLALLLTAVASLGTGEALAGTRSHTHHSSASALPATAFVETGTGRGGRKRKGAAAGGPRAKAAAGKHATGKQAAGGRAAKGREGRRGRSQRPETVNDPILMYRTSHRTGRAGANGGRAMTAHGDRLPGQSVPVHHGRVHGEGDPILVDAAGRPLSRARLRAMRRHAPALRWAGSSPATSSERNLASMRRLAGDGPAATQARTEAFAEGISHPDEDDRVLVTSVASPLVHIGTAAVMTANPVHTEPANVPANGQIVQGFGAEVAIASGDTSLRPGSTRRRDHPIAASALPGMQPAPTLEERAAITEGAVSPAVLPEIYDRNGRLVMPAPLKGSREVLVHQNAMASNDGLERIQDDGVLDRLRADHALVSFPVSGSLHVNEDLPYNRRYARPWTVLFATDIARDFYERFHQPIQVNSAVRTVAYQLRLQRINGNAAATDGDGASPHLTGQAIDLGKRGMTSAQLAWMRGYLMPLIGTGKIDVEEEFQQACFHISVYRRYAGGRLPAHEVAQVRPSAARPEAVMAGDLRVTP